MLKCECGQFFETRTSLRKHGRAKHGCKCNECNRIFTSSEGLKQHCLAIHHQCGLCDCFFNNRKALKHHQKLTAHCYCRACNLYFTSAGSLRRHEKSPGHVEQFHCCDCGRDFIDGSALEQHLKNKIHNKQPTEKQQHTKKGLQCDKCERRFSHETALEQHKASLAHRPLSDLKCIEAGCRKRFKCPSSLLHHLESGACVSGMDRDRLNEIVCARDTAQIIHTQDHSLPLTSSAWAEDDGSVSEYSDTSSESDEEVIYTPSTSSGLSITSSEIMIRLLDVNTSDSNGKRECNMCSRTFKSVLAFKQHWLSSVHTSTRFHCPVALLRDDDKPVAKRVRSFTTLSGLAQHIEAGACAGGVAILREAASYIESCLANMGMGRSILLEEMK